jgi:hypothetical protein
MNDTTQLHEANPLTERFQSAIQAVLQEERFGSLTVAEILGTIELVKWSIINRTPEK